MRLHRADHDAIWFGRDAAMGGFHVATNRFDSAERRYGVLYLAATRDGAFAESVGRVPGVFRSDQELADLRLTTLALRRAVRVVDLHGGAALGAIGATGVVGVGPHSLARRWSRGLHDHRDAPDGIEYRCRHNSDELALALFDRIGVESFHLLSTVTLTEDAAWLARMRQRHGIWRPPD
ncbi:MAG: RES family NAD+ phosphorylase [Rhodospirillales bacterium]|nr:RES family NAD+ phosphorylase [Rhodospirillales bacterium]